MDASGPPPVLAVSVVSYRTPDLLARCLDSLQVERARLPLEVTVGDNASGDGSAEMVSADYPWVRLLRHPRNLGFGAAHNVALRGARAPYLLVLNSDTTVRPGSLAALVAYLESHPEVAVVGPRLRYPDGRVQPSRRRFPTLATLFVESTQLQRFLPHHPLLARYYMADRSADEAQEVDWLVGACLALRARAAAEVGLFDERFFLYYEELDWCRRFRAAGWRVAYLPAAEVQHHEGASSARDLLARDLHFQRSRMAYAAKWHGRRAARLLGAYLALEYAARGLEEALKLALGSRPAERRERLRLIGGVLRQGLRVP